MKEFKPTDTIYAIDIDKEMTLKDIINPTFLKRTVLLHESKVLQTINWLSPEDLEKIRLNGDDLVLVVEDPDEWFLTKKEALINLVKKAKKYSKELSDEAEKLSEKIHQEDP